LIKVSKKSSKKTQSEEKQNLEAVLQVKLLNEETLKPVTSVKGIGKAQRPN
jgi:hypothetical protein